MILWLRKTSLVGSGKDLRPTTASTIRRRLFTDLARRICAACGEMLIKSEFSGAQWAKATNVQLRSGRCKNCVDSDRKAKEAPTTPLNKGPSDAVFTNNALVNPFSQSQHRYVAKGENGDGPNLGQAVVAKWFKMPHVLIETAYYKLDVMRGMHRAVELIDEWNQTKIIEQEIKVNVPQVWQFQIDESRPTVSGRMHLIEPYIQNYQKFNSNSGWADVGDEDLSSVYWPKVMQALSHFTYYASGRQNIVCDLAGGVIGGETGQVMTLSCPVVLSRRADFGVTDLGMKGMSTFFENHVCNEYCNIDWKVPKDLKRHHNPQQGTLMELAKFQEQAGHFSEQAPPQRKISKTIYRRQGYTNDDDDYHY